MSKFAGSGWRVGWEDFLSSATSFLRTILGRVEGALRARRGIIYTRPQEVWSRGSDLHSQKSPSSSRAKETMR